MSDTKQAGRRQRVGRLGNSGATVRVEFETRNQIKQQTRSQRQRQIAQEHEALARSEVQAASNASKAIFHDPRIDQPVEQPSLKQDESCGQKPDVKAITELSKDFKYEGKDKDDKPSRPWETLVIGASLGDNLSRVEYQSRRILQQEFIIEWSKCNEPDSVAFRQQILNDMIQEKEVMEQNDQNHIPADELRSKAAVAERLEILRSALKCGDYYLQRANIEAAIVGYEESQIRYSDGYTVLYAGAIVDTCSSYQSFATDREERLDGYLQEYGSGWLWYEPPLVGPNSKAYAKKGFALTQDLWSMNPDEGLHTNDFGLFPINMRFVVDAKKVHRADVSANVSSSTNAANRDTIYRDFPLRSATMKCLLDCGATFPMLGKSDFKYLGIDDFGTHYAPQTVMAIETASRIEHLPLYELKVEVGVAVNADVIIPYDIVKWRTLGRPQENGILGGLCPVAVSNKDQKELDWHQRLSGIFPFNVCYISSVPTTGTIWMGENRRDVLGAKRFPPFKRHVTDGTWDIEKPNNLADYIELVKDLDTPQEVIFTHRICGVSDSTKLDDLVDLDIESRGTTTYGIAKRVDDSERGRYNLEDAAEFGPAARR